MDPRPPSSPLTRDHVKKQAQDLVEVFRSGRPDALDRIRWNHPRFRELSDAEIGKHEFRLADARLVIARLHYFENWPALLKHIETIETGDRDVLRFELAADAITSGDVQSLRSLIREQPELVKRRSTRAHRAPLLHYVAANGVEDHRQISPPNAVDVGRALLDAGAEVDAVSDAYDGGWTALGLVATSTPPRRAGVQIPLIDVLLEYGAAVDGVRPDRSMVLSALENNCSEAAEALFQRGARVDDLVAAAGLGRPDLVERLRDGAAAVQSEKALIMAARYGRRDVVEFLLDVGVDVGASDGMTALHHAAGRGDLDMTRLLIGRGAPLEKRNAYGGTVLDNVLWFAHRADDETFAQVDYPAVIQTLIQAGARTDVYPEMHMHVMDIYKRAGKKIDP